MRISVIIPVHNRPEMIRRAVHSVLGQTRIPEEIILVDDGSTDETPDVLEKMRKSSPELIRVLTHEENRGVSAARNTGIQESSGGWIALLDSDDEWKPGKLGEQVNYHRGHPDLIISQCNEIWIRNGRRVNKRDIHRKQYGRFFQGSLKLCLVTASATIMHRDLFREVGHFDTNLPACEDYDFWLRVLKRYPIGLLDEPLVIRYGGHSDQLSSRFWGMDRWRVEAMEKHVDCDLPREWKIALYEELISKLSILQQGATKRNKPEAEIYQRKIEHYSARLQQYTGEDE